MAIAEPPRGAEEARAALAAEWEARAPETPEEVLAFYRSSEQLEPDLEAFHSNPDRQSWTAVLVHVARQVDAQVAIDIGCGAGHDLRALREAGVPGLYGVEPNHRLADLVIEGGIRCDDHVEIAPIERADLLSCFDVLEHIPDPEAFLGAIARRAKLGAVLVETCATHDTGTPLHLVANRGWRTGRCLEGHGWEKVGETGRLRVWRKMAQQNRVSTSLIPVTFRSVSLPTHRAIMRLLTADPSNGLGWREFPASEAGLLRARNVAASRWWTDTADDVFLMVDDDIEFWPEDAERIVTRCREGYDVIAAAYPVRDGGHLAARPLDDQSDSIGFGPGLPPVEVRHAGTGFFAVHRRVLDALIPTLPLCHANQTWAYWPIFAFRVIEDEAAGGFNELTEDYNLCEMVRELGFKVWLEPSVELTHYGSIPIRIANMARVREALA